MNTRHVFLGLTLLIGVCFAAVAVAQQAPSKKPAKQHMTPVPSTAMDEQITLDIHGAANNDAARSITKVLTEYGLHTTVIANSEANDRCVVKVKPSTDLGACGHALMTLSMTPKPQTPPSLDLVLFGKFDASSRQKAMDALAKLRGINAASSRYMSDKGEIEVRIVGGTRVTAGEIQNALKAAGLNTSFVKSERTARVSG